MPGHLLLGGLLQVGDQVRPVLLLPQAGKDHLGAGDELARLGQVLVQRLRAPRDALVLVRLHGKADDDDDQDDGGEDSEDGGDGGNDGKDGGEDGEVNGDW